MGDVVDSLTEGMKVFDRYTLMKVVGRGRFSVVWQAWDERLNRDTALKLLPDMVKADASALAKLKSEVRQLQEVKHDQIIAIDNVEQDGPLVAISSDFINGTTLSALREQKNDQVFSPVELAGWMQQLFVVLEFIHREALRPHGALRPSNILIDQKGTLRLSDYGLEQALLEFVSRTSDRKEVGQDLRYTSPQQAAGEANTALDDIYAVGVTLYELLTSKPPFYTGDIMLQLQQKIPPPMTHRRKELRVIGEPITRVWEETVAACMSKDPGQRPQNIAQLVEMLELKAAPAADLQVSAAAPPPPAPDAGNKTLVIAVVAAFLVIAAIAGLILGKKKQPATPGPGAGGTSQVAALSAKQLAEFEAKRKAADKAAADKLRAAELEAKKRMDQAAQEAKKRMDEADRMAKEQAKRLADAEKATKDAEAKLKAAEEESKRKLAEAEKARKSAVGGGMAEAEKLLKEAEAKRIAAEAEAKRLQEEAKKMKADEAKRLAAAEKAGRELEAKRLAAAKEAKRIADAAEVERRRMADIAAKQEEERLKQLAMLKQKEDEEKKMAMAIAERDRKAAFEKAKAEAEARRRFAPGKPWSNSLGMRLMPVGKVEFAITETRLSDFEAFYRATRFDAGKGWGNPGFKQGESHPVVNVSWDDAKAFCKWLTEKERKEGLIDSKTYYRLPTDVEWSLAVGLQNEPGSTPAERDGRVKGVYPWGNAWPPSIGAGNFADNVSYDRFEKTAPVGSFMANRYGLYDMAGNVWEWCEDWSDSSQKTRVLRGGSWFGYIPGSLFSSYRRHLPPNERRNDHGFRCVLASE